MNLTKGVKDIYIENFNTLVREIEKHIFHYPLTI